MSGYQIFKILDIPIKIHWTYLLFVAFFMAMTAQNAGILLSLYVLGILWLMVLCHELSHAIVAKSYGFEIDSINIHALGGAALILELEESKPLEEIFISVAGPAFNIFIGMVFFAIHLTLFHYGIVDIKNDYLLLAWFLNFFMGVFNLIPAYPLDGGRIVKAGLGIFLGNVKATEMVMTGNIVIASIMMIVAVIYWMPLVFFIFTLVLLNSISKKIS